MQGTDLLRNFESYFFFFSFFKVFQQNRLRFLLPFSPFLLSSSQFPFPPSLLSLFPTTLLLQGDYFTLLSLPNPSPSSEARSSSEVLKTLVTTGAGLPKASPPLPMMGVQPQL